MRRVCSAASKAAPEKRGGQTGRRGRLRRGCPCCAVMLVRSRGDRTDLDNRRKVLSLELLALIAAAGAGAFGAVVGVGGGIVLVPLLTLFLGVPVHADVAVSLLGVIAVSTTASASYLGGGFVDRRVGLTLLVATALGGIAGGYIAGYLDARVISGLFGVVLVLVAVQMLRARRITAPDIVGDPERFEFDSSYIEPTTGTVVPYRARRVGLGGFVSVFAGAL